MVQFAAEDCPVADALLSMLLGIALSRDDDDPRRLPGRRDRIGNRTRLRRRFRPHRPKLVRQLGRNSVDFRIQPNQLCSEKREPCERDRAQDADHPPRRIHRGLQPLERAFKFCNSFAHCWIMGAAIAVGKVEE